MSVELPKKKMKAHLMSWGSGTFDPAGDDTAGPAARTIVLASADLAPDMAGSDVAGPATVVFAPTGAEHSAGAQLVEYEGSVAESGEELSVGEDFFVQIQDYATSEYMSALGPTLVRILEEGDFTAYLADADAARDAGTFREFLVSPAVQLADLPGLGADPHGDGPRRRLFVAESGAASTSPTGVELGVLGDGIEALTTRWQQINAGGSPGCAVCLGAVVDEAQRAGALAQRPWLGRYLAAVAARRDLSARGVTGAQVSGFGNRLTSAASDVADPADDTGVDVPLVLWTAEAVYVHHPVDSRTFELNRPAGELAELLAVCGSLAAATEFADAGQLGEVAARFADAGVPLVSQPGQTGR